MTARPSPARCFTCSISRCRTGNWVPAWSIAPKPVLCSPCSGCFPCAVSLFLPLVGLLGALAKESFVPMSAMATAGWAIHEWRMARWRLSDTIWSAAMVLVALATIVLLSVHHRRPAGSAVGVLSFPQGQRRRLAARPDQLRYRPVLLVRICVAPAVGRTAPREFSSRMDVCFLGWRHRRAGHGCVE
jgi:hypothetical protein